MNAGRLRIWSSLYVLLVNYFSMYFLYFDGEYTFHVSCMVDIMSQAPCMLRPC